ncbi:hypothetical protein KW850_31400 [Bacillus sp. sid0103]|nr:hypothetical protein [Bacillus sp. sid0103]MBV7509629.1 hypothetical protein [Bacillus sp. sid0103]
MNSEYSERELIEMTKILELYSKLKDTEVFKIFYEETDVFKRVKLEKLQM